MPNKNEREWWNNPNTPLWLLPPHCISVEGRTRDGLVFVGQAHRLGDLVAEERKRVLAEVRGIVEKKYEKEAHLNKHCGDKPKHELCKDCTWGVNVMAEYHDILSRLDSLDKME